MTSSLLYMFFEHGRGESIYSLYAVELPSDPLPSKESFESHNLILPSPTLLFDRNCQRYPSGMRCVLFDSKFYFLGGQKELEDKERYPPNVFIFDPATATAATADPTNTKYVTEAETHMTTGKPEPLLLFVADDKMYALSSPHVFLDAFVEYFEVFDPSTKKWAHLPRPPFKEEFIGMEQAVVNRKVYIMAGEYRTWNEYALHCFDLDSKQWIPTCKLKCPALPLRYSIAGFVQGTVYGCFNDTIVGFGPVKDNDEDGGGELFKRLMHFSPEGPVNFFERPPIMVDTSSILMHLENKRFCYVVSGNRPLPKDAEDLRNDPQYRHIILTIFEAHDCDTCSTAKFQYSAHYVDETTRDNGVAILHDCMLIPKMKCEDGECKKFKGTVVLMCGGVCGGGLNDARQLLGEGVSLQLISVDNGDPTNGLQGKLGKPAYLEEWITKIITPPIVEESVFKVTFDWDEEIGVPGAFIVKNNHKEFYLKTLTLEDVPGQGRIHFVCNSWVYPNKDRVFFANKTYLPSETPMPLRKYREDELLKLRGNRKGELQECDRVYDYDFYNDLWDPDNDLKHPDKDPKYVRPVLGGSTEYPYPRRGRTGRPPHCIDRNRERRPIIRNTPPLSIYVPRDEQFCRQKMLASLAYQSKLEFLFHNRDREPLLYNTCTCGQFYSFQNLSLKLKLYEEGIKHDNSCLWKPYLTNDGVVKFPMPQVIKENRSAWMTDEEFAREMLAGVNPVVIGCLQEFPPTSKLDPTQSSSITEEDIKDKLDRLTIDEAIKTNKLFILDHYDALMPYLWRINNTSTKTYASRTLLFLKDDGTLKPLVIELSKPDREGDKFCAISKVYKPSEGFIWQLAKAYVTVNDSVYHQLISNWLNTHAVIEPFVIATNRQLSVLHPIYKLLHPHFHDTMNINAFARLILINSGGVLESTLFPSKYAMEMSSAVYKNWVFPDQALPEDLKNRGMAVEDSNSPHGLRLLITDYPYAVDGLEIWSSIKTWVEDYCSFYYGTDEKVQKDFELQSWWKELREEGHGDKKDEPWWPQMQTRKELVDTCTIIIWVASALHAAVNFGQYAYAGYVLNRPTISLKFMPEKASEYAQLTHNPDTVFLKTFTHQLRTLIGISLVEFLSRHSMDEVYLGQRDTPEWTSDEGPLQAFEKFGNNLADIEKRIIERNNDESLKNRVGPIKMPYTLLFPTSESGLTGKGIPNSVSI